MSEGADRAIAVMRSGFDRLAGRVEKMGAAELAAPSGAAQWTVAQVLSHLGGGAETMLAALDGAVDGTGPPPGEFNQSVWNRWDALAPAEQAAGFLRAGEALVARYEGLDGAARSALRVDLGFLPKPVDVPTAVGLRVGEQAFHTWDVEVASDPAATLPAEVFDLIFATTEMFLPHITRPDVIVRPTSRAYTLAIDLTEPRKSFGLVLGPKVSLLEGTPAEVDGVFRGPAEAWLRLVAGRLAEANTPAGVSLYGGTVTLADLRNVFPGY